ncbi:MAG TPA: hypothetical protein VG429_04085 [Casimicrobiaceae bacterium]|nr:hypothetical protein [Casimicrobiaceae bacterium]
MIGDGCTDGTAAVVGRYTDPRIRFFNLPERVGDLSLELALISRRPHLQWGR